MLYKRAISIYQSNNISWKKRNWNNKMINQKMLMLIGLILYSCWNVWPSFDHHELAWLMASLVSNGLAVLCTEDHTPSRLIVGAQSSKENTLYLYIAVYDAAVIGLILCTSRRLRKQVFTICSWQRSHTSHMKSTKKEKNHAPPLSPSHHMLFSFLIMLPIALGKEVFMIVLCERVMFVCEWLRESLV